MIDTQICHLAPSSLSLVTTACRSGPTKAPSFRSPALICTRTRLFNMVITYWDSTCLSQSHQRLTMPLLDSVAAPMLFPCLLGRTQAVPLYRLATNVCVIRKRTHHCPYASPPTASVSSSNRNRFIRLHMKSEPFRYSPSILLFQCVAQGFEPLHRLDQESKSLCDHDIHYV